MDTQEKIRQHISAFADGSLCSTDRELAMAALQTDDGRLTWQLYHRIGDVLRSESVPELSPSFSARLSARLDEEAVPLRRNLKSAVPPERGSTGMHLLPAAGAPVTIAPGAVAPGAAAPGAGAPSAPTAPAAAAPAPEPGTPGSGLPDTGAGGGVPQDSGATFQARPVIIIT